MFSSEQELVEATIGDLGERPPNVEHVVALNRGPLVEELSTPLPMTPRAVEVAIAEGWDRAGHRVESG